MAPLLKQLNYRDSIEVFAKVKERKLRRLLKFSTGYKIHKMQALLVSCLLNSRKAL